MLVRVVELRPLPTLKKRERDRRFALTRCRSGGDSNSRCAFNFPMLMSGPKFWISQPDICDHRWR